LLSSDTTQKNTQTGRTRGGGIFWTAVHLETRLQWQQRACNSSLRGADFAHPQRAWNRLRAGVVGVAVRKKTPKRDAPAVVAWNLYRHEAAPASQKSSLLFGTLSSINSGVAANVVRLFYIPHW